MVTCTGHAPPTQTRALPARPLVQGCGGRGGRRHRAGPTFPLPPPGAPGLCSLVFSRPRGSWQPPTASTATTGVAHGPPIAGKPRHHPQLLRWIPRPWFTRRPGAEGAVGTWAVTMRPCSRPAGLQAGHLTPAPPRGGTKKKKEVQKQAAGCVWPVGNNFVNPALKYNG